LSESLAKTNLLVGNIDTEDKGLGCFTLEQVVYF